MKGKSCSAATNWKQFSDRLPWDVVSNPVEVDAPAKINLRLKVLGRRYDGYHLLSMLNATCELRDTVAFTLTPDQKAEVVMEPHTSEAVAVADNLVTRAFVEFWRAVGCETAPVGFRAVVTKRIPIGGGLGGGSSDAGAVLRYLTRYLGAHLCTMLGISSTELDGLVMSAAARVGADVPYAYHGGLCWVTGIGEVVSPFRSAGVWNHEVLLAIPPAPVPTADFYRFFRELYPGLDWEEVKRDCFMEAVHAEGTGEFSRELISNDFEEAAGLMVPVVATTLYEARRYFPETTALTGSGSTVFSVVTGMDGDRIQAFTARMEEIGVRVLRTRLRADF